MAYSKSFPNNKFAPSTVVSMASKTSNRPMSYGQVYENLNYEMGMHKISDTDRKWMACRKNFINSNRRAFEELQIKVGKLIEAGKIPPNYANNLDKICTEDEFNEIQAEVNRMESSRAIDRTGHFRAGTTPKNEEKSDKNEEKSDENEEKSDKNEGGSDSDVTDSDNEGGSDGPPDQTEWPIAVNNNLNPTNKIKKPRKKKVLSEKQIAQKEEKLNEKKILAEKKKKLADDKIEFEDRHNEQADAKKAAKEAKYIAKINFNKANTEYKENKNDETLEHMETAAQTLNEASEAYKKLTETFNDKVWDEVDKKIDERKIKKKGKTKEDAITEKKTKKDAITEDVKILTEDKNKILLKNVPNANVIKQLKILKIEKIEKIPQKNNTQLTTEKIRNEIKNKRLLDIREKNKIDENVRIEVEAAKELAVKDGLLIRTEKGKYIPNINKNDIGTLRKVKKGKKAFTISGHTADDITTVGKNKYVLRKNKSRAAQNYWSESLKTSLKISGTNTEKNVKMVGPAEFKKKYNTNEENEENTKLIKNLNNYVTVMTEYLNLIRKDEKKKYNLAEKEEKVKKTEQKLNDAKNLLTQYNPQTAQQNPQPAQQNQQPAPQTPQAAITDVDYTAQKRADAQRISAMDRDYRQSFQAAYQQKPFKVDRYKLGSSDMHDWPSSAGSSVSSNRDSWYAEWNANRSY